MRNWIAFTVAGLFVLGTLIFLVILGFGVLGGLGTAHYLSWVRSFPIAGGLSPGTVDWMFPPLLMIGVPILIGIWVVFSLLGAFRR